MADENININVKSNIGDVSKDAGNAASEFKVMGVSLNGVKRGFASAAVTAKGMFGSIKAGLISTGIGAFVVLVGSLIAYFKSTKDGAEKLERAMAGFGAVVSVITDRLSSFGKVIVSAFEDPQQAIADLWEAIKTNLLNRVQGIIDAFGFLGKTIQSALSFDWDEMKENAAGFGESMVQVATGVDDLTGKMAEGFKSLGDEIEKDVAAAMKLKGLTQQLRDEEREFNKVRAQTRQEIQKARLDALDESKTAEERLAALQTANELELKTTNDVLEMQKRKIQIQKETMALSENMAEDLDELANLEVGLIDLQTSSFQTQKRLATEMETLTNEIAANKKAKQKEEADAIKKLADAEIAEKERVKKAELALEKLKEKEKEKMIGMGFAAAKQLAGESEDAQKAVAVAKTIYNTQQAIMNTMANVPAPFNLVQAIATGAMGAASIQKILSTSSESASGGGSVSAPATSSTPAPQMMSGAFDLSGGLEPEPTRAYVITDEMTSSQNQLANIRRRATI